MSLDTRQKIALHQVLEIPYFPTVNRLDDEDHLLVTPRTVTVSARQAKAVLDDLLGSLSSEEEEVLVVYLDRWIALGTKSYRIDGGVGGVQGYADSPDEERKEIMRQVAFIIPFWERLSNVERKGNGGYIPVIR